MKIWNESPIRDSQPNALHPPRPLAQETTGKEDTGGGWLSSGFNRRDSVVMLDEISTEAKQTRTLLYITLGHLRPSHSTPGK